MYLYHKQINFMLRLIVDQGNSYTKVTLFEQGQMLKHQSLPDSLLDASLSEILQKNKLTSAIFSTVRKNKTLPSFLEKSPVHFLQMNPEVTLPFSSIYQTPLTLGNDRLANAAAAMRKFPARDVLIVDCGSCITYSLLRQNVFHGGTIAPGIQMRFNALNHFTGRLPQIEISGILPSLIGDSTENSIRSGVELAIIAETDAMIALYCSKIPDLVVIITGGSIQFFEQYLKIPTFAAPYLTPEGLHEILLLNEN
jgi:type III pantothenate kinase